MRGRRICRPAFSASKLAARGEIIIGALMLCIGAICRDMARAARAASCSARRRASPLPAAMLPSTKPSSSIFRARLPASIISPRCQQPPPAPPLAADTMHFLQSMRIADYAAVSSISAVAPFGAHSPPPTSPARRDTRPAMGRWAAEESAATVVGGFRASFRLRAAYMPSSPHTHAATFTMIAFSASTSIGHAESL